ncbi:MAG: Methyltransferase type 12, partial [Alphaproteobacteria bacterium]|nr:Methyltransferase type 12 [Alphaproteobacteria bacterium]
MRVVLARQKARLPLMAVLYLIKRALPFAAKSQLNLFLDLAWIFHRFAHETSFHVYEAEKHPVRRNEFLLGGIKPSDRVLDLGCSIGVITASIAKITPHVLGVDHDAAAIELAQRAYPDIEFRVGDARDYLGKEFDVLILSHVLEHLDRSDEFLRAMSGHFARLYIE